MLPLTYVAISCLYWGGGRFTLCVQWIWVQWRATSGPPQETFSVSGGRPQETLSGPSVSVYVPPGMMFPVGVHPVSTYVPPGLAGTNVAKYGVA